MFTIEIKINGSLIAHIHGLNECSLENGKDKYRYEYYEVESRKVVSGHVEHERSNGIRQLLQLILQAVDNKKPKQ